MPTRTVSQGFDEFHKRLVASDTETEAARRHRVSIEACLKSNFGSVVLTRSGSFGNGTNIRSFSDIDYFASLTSSAIKTSSSATLSEVASALRTRFPTTSGIRVDSPAVVVPFGTDASEAHEIIPADLVNLSSPFVYRIADGSGGWMRSSPPAQKDYVRSVDADVKGRAKPLIRFLKAWKYYRNVPVSSFYLELVAAKHAAGTSTIIYSWDVRDVFEKLGDSGLADVGDPAGRSGKVAACRTAALRADALSKTESAANRSRWAKESEDAGDTRGAFRWWGMLYDGNFPSHYY